MTMPNDRNAGFPTDTLGSDMDDEPTAGGTGKARDQIRQVKDQVVDQAKSSFRQAKDSASSSLSQSRTQAAEKIGGIANAVRSTGDHLRSENQPGVADLTDSLADQVERLSGYLRDRDLTAFRNDVEGFARRQPAVAVGVALALGLLGARFLKSSQRSGSSARSYRDDSYDYDFDRDRYGTDAGDFGTGPAGGYGMGSQPAGGGYGGA
ncbi:MAG TPA: hypothetical protein VMY76_06430 [Gemmatimonadales bacterium]|nr:hypothetical protein [Gemmatimonadales bacterium]